MNRLTIRRLDDNDTHKVSFSKTPSRTRTRTRTTCLCLLSRPRGNKNDFLGQLGKKKTENDDIRDSLEYGQQRVLL